MGCAGCVRPVAGRGALAGCRKGPEYDRHARYIARDGEGPAVSFRDRARALYSEQPRFASAVSQIPDRASNSAGCIPHSSHRRFSHTPIMFRIIRRRLTGNTLYDAVHGVLKIAWWLWAAWFLVALVRAFIVSERRPREGKLIQDLLAGRSISLQSFPSSPTSWTCRFKVCERPRARSRSSRC